MRQPNVTVYGSHSCSNTNRTTRCLDARSIPYEFKSVDDFPEFNDYIAELNNGKRVTPTIQVNNDVFFNPSDDELLAAVTEAAGA
jgi:thioredoxin reductase (NADPH)